MWRGSESRSPEFKRRGFDMSSLLLAALSQLGARGVDSLECDPIPDATNDNYH
jgi:hypothetical protein